MLKKVLATNLILLQIFTQTAFALEFQPIIQLVAVQPVQISSANLKNKNPLSVSDAFLFFKLAECSKLGLCLNNDSAQAGTNVILPVGRMTASLRLANFGAYQAFFSSQLANSENDRGNPSSNSMTLPQLLRNWKAKSDNSLGFIPAASLGKYVAAVMTYPTVAAGTPVSEFTYNTHGQVTEVKDPNNNITQYAYNATTGYLQTITRDPGNINAVTTLTYDANGYPDTVTDPNNNTTNYDYDALGWLNQVTDPLSRLTKYTYDANGNVTKIEQQADALATTWQTTNFTYTLLNHVATVTDPLNRVTTYIYDETGTLPGSVQGKKIKLFVLSCALFGIIIQQLMIRVDMNHE